MGDRVLSNNGKWNRIYDKWNNPPAKGLEIICENGASFKAKFGHRVLVGDNHYKDIVQLSIGETLKTQHLESGSAVRGETRIVAINEITTDSIDIAVENDPSYSANGFIHHNSRSIFEQIERTLDKPEGKFLRQCLKGEPKHKSDAWEMNLGESQIVALPLGCVEKNSLIKTNTGYKPIHSLKNKRMKEGEWDNIYTSVACMSDDSGWNRSSHILYAGHKNGTKITTSRGLEIVVSMDHKLLTVSGSGDLKWVEARDLLSHSVLILERKEQWPLQPEYNLTYELGKQYGIRQIFSTTTDERILSCNRDFARGFLAGVFDDNGKITKNPFRSVSEISLSVKFLREKIAKQIQLLLLNFGIVAYRSKQLIYISGQDLVTFYDEIGGDISANYFSLKSKLNAMKRSRKPEYGKKTGAYIAGLAQKGYLTDYLVKKKRTKGHFYDLRVPAKNHYFSNGFVSHNSGEKIRGYRFNLLIIDELLLLSEKIVNEVLMPFMAVQMNQRERQYVREAEDKLIKAGALKEEERTIFPNNKLIGLTSASYQFEYLYEMFQSYKNLIFDEKAEKVSHGLMQLSYEMAPKGLYDESNVNNAKKTFSRSQFDREYMAVFTGDSSGFFSAKKLYEVSLKAGESPTTKIKGDPEKAYILGIDPNYDSSETSDDFAMCLVELDEESKTGIMVHGYALPSCTIQQRMEYLKYLFDNFNIIYLIIDKAGGEKFIKDVNDLGGLGF